MNSLRVMICMTFGTLDNVSEPLRCFNICVLKDAEEVRHKKHHCNRLGCKSGNETETNASQNGPAYHIKWTKEERPICIQSLGAVMHLVKRFPEKITPVEAVMPGKNAKLIEQNADQPSPQRSQFRPVKELVRLKVWIDEQWQIG